jgi:hypothetical protein
LCSATTRTRKKHAALHTEHRADTAIDCCTQNIVPSEKWQLGHSAAKITFFDAFKQIKYDIKLKLTI